MSTTEASTSSNSTSPVSNPPITNSGSNGGFGFGIGGRFTSMLGNFAQKVKTVVTEEQENIKKILLEDESAKQKELMKKEEEKKQGILPPWLDFHLEDKKLEEEIRTQIMNLTKSKRNFLNAPPDDANFEFDYDKALPVALISLQADSNLSNARFYLVPKYVKEPKFWRNYFYRVYIIKEAHGLNLKLNATTGSIVSQGSTSTPSFTSISAPTTSTTSLSTSTTSSTSATSVPNLSTTTTLLTTKTENEDKNNLEVSSDDDIVPSQISSHSESMSENTLHEDEFISDNFNDELNLNTLKTELDQLGYEPGERRDREKDIHDLNEDWENELQKELEGKINQNIEISEEWEEELKKELGTN